MILRNCWRPESMKVRCNESKSLRLVKAIESFAAGLGFKVYGVKGVRYDLDLFDYVHWQC